ncbi:hypothetical protein Dimus_023899, partial [Dionaea muscipula]
AFQTQVYLRGGLGRGRGSFRGRGRNDRGSGHSQKDECLSSNGGRGHGARQQDDETNESYSIKKYCKKRIANEGKNNSSFMHEINQNNKADSLFLAFSESHAQ